MNYKGVIHRYHKYLPVKTESIITLHEGNTPLIPAERMRRVLQLSAQLYLKFEGMNPTGSFKDRGMTYAVSKAHEDGAKAIICASTGNTSASAAAYSAKANIRCVVLIPEGKIAYGKLSQAMIHGSTVVQIQGNFDEALQMVIQLGQHFPIHIVNSVNPYRLHGQKTAAFEICEALGDAPDFHSLPVGNAGNISAYWMGYKEWKERGHTSKTPCMLGFQAALAAPLVLGRPIKSPETIASAIRIGNPASWTSAIQAKEESKGIIDKVTDTEIVKAYKMVSTLEGIFCEPASAISIAGLIKLNKKNPFKKNQIVVCTLTGHGLKDPDVAIKNSPKPFTCKNKLDDLVKILKL